MISNNTKIMLVLTLNPNRQAHVLTAAPCVCKKHTGENNS